MQMDENTIRHILLPKWYWKQEKCCVNCFILTVPRMPCSEQGELLTDQLDELVRPNTKAMILLHASNVCGTFNATGSGECLLPKAQVAFFAGFGPNRRRFPY